jgi:hypothetical protein
LARKKRIANNFAGMQEPGCNYSVFSVAATAAPVGELHEKWHGLLDGRDMTIFVFLAT